MPESAKTSVFRSVCAAACLGLAAVAATAGTATAKNYNVCGGSPGGLWSLLGAGLDQAVGAAEPGSTVTYQTSSGGYANIVQVTQGKCELGIIHVGEGISAQKGREPFKEPVEGFKVLMVLYDWAPMQWVVSKEFADEHGLTSLADLKEKKPPLRLVLNRRGILPSQLAEADLENVGISLDDIDEWGGKVEFQGSKNASEIMQNRRADMWVNATFVGSSSIRNIADAYPVTLLSVPEDVVEKMVEDYGAKPFTVKAGDYPWLDRDVTTHAARAALVVDEDMSDEEAYKLTKAVLDNVGKIQAVHNSMKDFTPELMQSLEALPYHPGAQKAYDEAGN